MKNIFLKLLFLLPIISCFLPLKSRSTNSDVLVVFHSRFYINSILVGEKYYNSKTGVYKIYEKTSSTFIDKKIKITLLQKDVYDIYDKYKELKIPNRKLCMKMKEENEDILIERQILVNSDNINEFKECAVKDYEQANIDMITSKLLNLIKSSEEYKKAFPQADWEIIYSKKAQDIEWKNIRVSLDYNKERKMLKLSVLNLRKDSLHFLWPKVMFGIPMKDKLNVDKDEDIIIKTHKPGVYINKSISYINNRIISIDSTMQRNENISIVNLGPKGEFVKELYLDCEKSDEENYKIYFLEKYIALEDDNVKNKNLIPIKYPSNIDLQVIK
jgi:hypothetical protein